MAPSKKRLGDLLVETGIITKEQLMEALKQQQETREKLGDVLMDLGYITEHQLIEVLEFQLGIPRVELSKFSIDPELAKLLPEKIMKTYQVIPYERSGKTLKVAMVDPMDYYAIEDLRMRTGYNIVPVLTSKHEFQRGLAGLFGLSESMNRMMEEMDDPPEEQIQQTEITNEDSPVVRLVNQMLEQAVALNVSDIHIDPMEKHVHVRYRMDGELRTERLLPKRMQGTITARLKIMSNLNIAERRLPQDGRMNLRFGTDAVDVRVSTLPTVFGEKVVLRLLNTSAGIKRLDRLDFSEHNLQLFLNMLRMPYGMILMVGPTGSGKTTTLYSGLQQLNKESINIITVEDPVEYQLEGINQVQVNSKIGLTFATGLRSILRQDPNIIMIGEIRDLETAQIAVRAALTGHLVFSTLHTNDSIRTITRLRDMGVEPYLIASSLNCIVSQRLVRRICQDCKTSYEPSEQERILFQHLPMNEEIKTLYKGKGCSVCNDTGYRGRMAIHEVLPFDSKLRELIVREASYSELRHHATSHGMIPLVQDCLEKVRKGETTLQEWLRETSDETSLNLS